MIIFEARDFHSAGNYRIFYHSDFTWNQNWRNQSLKICCFNTLIGSEIFFFLWICAIFKILQNWFHILKSGWQKNPEIFPLWLITGRQVQCNSTEFFFWKNPVNIFFEKKNVRKFWFFPHCAYLFPVIYREQIAAHFRILCLGPSFSPTPSELGGWFFTPRTPFYGRRRVDPHISTWGGHRGYLLGSRVRGVNHMMVWSWSRRRTEITKKKNFQFF